jgi:hypothetical protein
MRKVYNVIFALTLICMQTSCVFAETVKTNNLDESINGIRLLDSASYVDVIGDDIRFYKDKGVLYTQHYNSIGNEMLTIISSPKDKFSATKFRIMKLDKKFAMKRNVMHNVIRFKTKKGICLGMSPTDVIKVLGDQYEKEINKDAIVVYRYKNITIKTKNMERSDDYKSEYHFYNNKLIEFVFGL